jgi:hypothetical protein
MKHRMEALIPLLFLAAALPSPSPAQTYDLRGPAPKQGTILQERSEWKMSDGALTIEADGTVVRGRIDQENVSTEEVEIVQASGSQVTMLKYRVAEGWTRTTSSGEVGSSIQVEDGPLVGETALIERRHDGWSKTLLGREPDQRQKEWLAKPFVDESEIYPAVPVAAGESWVVDAVELAALLGLDRALSVDGKATFTLDRVADEDGDRRAVVSYRLEIRGSVLDDDKSPVDFKLGGSGVVRRSLTSYLDVSNRLTGQQYFEGTRVEEGKRARVTVAGPVEMTGSQTAIGDGDRAAVVRQARTERLASKPAAAPARPAPPSPPANASPWYSGPTSSATAGPPSCKGTALACQDRNAASCDAGWWSSGCSSSGSCSGSTWELCIGKPQFSCSTTPGCFWAAWSNSCAGVATCAGRSQWNCGSGCTWQATCTGYAKSCESIRKPGNCAAQPGCAWR